MFWIQPLDVWNKQTRTLNMDGSTNIYINKNIVIKSFERWLYARISNSFHGHVQEDIISYRKL